MVTPRTSGGTGLEWLVTNGIGGFASAPVGMSLTRRYHGLLVAAAGDERTVLLSRLDDGFDRAALVDFRLELGLPVWTLRRGDAVLERRALMRHGENAFEMHYRVVADSPPTTLRLRPWLDVRDLEGDVGAAPRPVAVQCTPAAVECVFDRTGVDVTVQMRAAGHRFVASEERREQEYPLEAQRGYPSRGSLWSPGWFDVDVDRGGARFEARVGSPAPEARGKPARDTMALELQRREHILTTASLLSGPLVPPQLVLAADQFLVTTTSSVAAPPDGIIAGYHWFGRWGRDTMISLEGLMLRTGRWDAASAVLREIVRHVRGGLIPNYFPDHGAPAYHTADATLWMFHALHRYTDVTADESLVTDLLPVLRDIVDWHIHGTDFGIHVDLADGLLTQGTADLPLTWMDAKVGEWVVTPRRGKAVELQALWYNALRLLAEWERGFGDARRAQDLDANADRAQVAFNLRFWNRAAGSLHDVVDGADGVDSSCRPNQLFALSLDHPILDPARWSSMLSVVEEHLLTPVGLRTLSPADPEFQPRYDGDRMARDAAYHQGTVWPWLIGAYVDALARAEKDLSRARAVTQNLLYGLDRMCAGQLNEIFDAEPPYAPRGCVAQAWSVAELIRAVRATSTPEAITSDSR